MLKLGDTLVEAKLLSSDQLKTALDYQKKTGLKLGEVLEKLGFVSEDEILACLASQQSMEIVNLKNIIIPNALVKKIPLQLIEKHNIIPVGIKGDTLTIATSDPTDYEAVEQVQLLTDLKVDMVLATTTEIKTAIRDVFQPAHRKAKGKDDILDELSGVSKNKKKPANSDEILNHPLTRLLIETHRDLKLIDPKINARISRNHPPAYYELLAACAVGGNSLAIFNDDVVISSNQRMGKALEDCRLYVGGGCQENVIEECEVNSRATIYLNLLAVFRLGFFPDSLASFCRANGIQPRPYESCQSYDALHDVFLANLKDVVDAHIRERNRTEGEGWRYNPCPLHSATLGDCLARRRDMMAGGCRYNFGSVSLTGIGTLVDSLFAVKAVCFDAPKVSYADLRRMLETDFKGEDAFRAYLLNRVPKFGQAGDPDLRAFSARVFADVARVTAGMPNTRGGRYEASLFSFRSFTHFGQSTGATPDGRRAGEHLSSGMSPSMQALGSEADLGRLLTALEPLDMTRYPVVAVLDVKLPALSGGMRPAFIVPVLRRFLEAGGSVLQTNCVDQAVLEDARRHPDRHPDLVVRVSGFSSVFVRLSESIQDEIIARTRATI